MLYGWLAQGGEALVIEVVKQHLQLKSTGLDDH